MSDLANQLFESLKAGLQRFGAEVGATFDQKMNQGASEAANLLFHESNGFVLYGPGQNPNMFDHGRDKEHEQGQEQGHDQGHELEMGGRER
jgi:hypothetical protein